MSTFVINSQTLNAQYEYKDSSIIVQGNFVKDAANGTLQSIYGSCYRPNQEGGQGEFIGNFNGYPRNGEIRYDLSEMTRSDSNLVWNAIDAIEAEILPQD